MRIDLLVKDGGCQFFSSLWHFMILAWCLFDLEKQHWESSCAVQKKLKAIEKDRKPYTLENDELKVQESLLKRDLSRKNSSSLSRKDSSRLSRQLSKRYPGLPLTEALRTENEMLRKELQVMKVSFFFARQQLACNLQIWGKLNAKNVHCQLDGVQKIEQNISGYRNLVLSLCPQQQCHVKKVVFMTISIWCSNVNRR
jgi:hypothetical protein